MTTPTVEAFIGEARYDKEHKCVAGVHPLFVMRTYSSVAQLFVKGTKVDWKATEQFQDSLGEWIADAINQKLKSQHP